MLKYLNELFRTIPITIPIFTSICYLIKRDNFILLFTIAFLSLSLVFTHILKFLFTYFKFIFDYFNAKSILGNFSRPEGAKNCGNYYVSETNYSTTSGMPSGHSLLAGFFSVFMYYYLIEKYKIEKKNHDTLFLICICFTFYTMYTRVHFGCHTIQQTIIGTLFGMILGKYYFLLSKKLIKNYNLNNNLNIT